MGDQSGGTELSKRMLYKAALNAHRHGDFDKARASYEAIVEQGQSRFASRSRRQLERLDRNKPPRSGRMGFVAFGALLLLAAVAFLVPPPVRHSIRYPLVVAGLAIPAGALWSLFQEGVWNRAAAFLALFVLLAFIATYDPNDSPRSRVTEGLSLASAVKTAAAEYFIRHGRLPWSNAEAGIAGPEEIAGDSVQSVTISNGGLITVMFKGSWLDGETLVLTPKPANRKIFWDCLGGTLHQVYRPTSCRSE